MGSLSPAVHDFVLEECTVFKLIEFVAPENSSAF